MNARGVVEVVVALTGLRLGVLNVATYTIIVLVAIVTSVMAPPLLRYATARLAQNEDERLRKIEHDTWNGLPALDRDVTHRGRTEHDRHRETRRPRPAGPQHHRPPPRPPPPSSRRSGST